MFTHILPRGETPLGTGVDADLFIIIIFFFKSERTLRTKQLKSIQRKK